MKTRILILLAVFAATASAQQTEVGGFGGIGTFAAEDTGNHPFWVAGAEACFLCQGKLAIFADYTHYGNTNSSRGTRITSADLLSGGLRVQRPHGRVRPFFDVGATGGADRFRSAFRGGHESHAIFGLALGGGATIALSERWYVRPAVRTQFLGPGLHVGLSASASVGFRF